MFTCLACSKQLDDGGSSPNEKNSRENKQEIGSFESETPRTKQAIKTLSSQIKDIALKASGAYRSCKPCPGFLKKYADSDTASELTRFNYFYRRTMGSSGSTPRTWGKEMETRHGGVSSGEDTPETTIYAEEAEPKEWIAQVEPGVLITFVALPRGGNDLKRIRFSREIFSKWQAQRWWSDNYEKVMELYNVRRLGYQSVASVGGGGGAPPHPPSRSEDEPGSVKNNPKPTAPSLGRRQFEDAPPNSAREGGDKPEASSGNESTRTSLSGEAEHSGEISPGNASDMETEWVEQDEPGVYITIRALPDGTSELRRVRFSRERFGEAHARLWWEENRARIQQQYLG